MKTSLIERVRLRVASDVAQHRAHLSVAKITHVGSAAVTILILGTVCCCTARTMDSTPGGWLAGYAQADITPEVGRCQMGGFGRERVATGTLTPLLVQVLALRDRSGQTGILITADLLGFDRTLVEPIRRAIAAKHGVPAEGVLLAASHTHWGPAVRLHARFSTGVPNVWYLAQLEETILDRVEQALASLVPADIDYGSIDFRGIGCCRRFPKEGTIRFAPNPNGSFDGHTPILRVERDGSPRQVVVVGHGCHPTSSGPIGKWSPDYPGAMRDALETQLPDTKSLFVQGCGGDAKVVYRDPATGELAFAGNPRQSKEAGQKLAQAVLHHLDEGPRHPLDGRLRCALVTGYLSHGKRWDLAEIERVAYTGSRKRYLTWAARQYLAFPNERTRFRYDVQIWKLGDRLTLFGMEGEVCSPWGPVLRSVAQTDHAMVVGYANNTTAYIPDRRIVVEGGYEGSTALKYVHPGPFSDKIDDEITAIVAEALDVCRTLSNPPPMVKSSEGALTVRGS